MRGVIFLVLAALFAAAFAHFATIAAYPTFATGVARERLSGGPEGVNQWRHAPRVTERSRAVVRPSPDLAYSSCVFDLWLGPVDIEVGPSEGMWSLSLYGRDGTAFAVFTDIDHPEGVSVTLIRAGAAPPPGAGITVQAPDREGIALMRRLAPDADAFIAAGAARQSDVCAPRRQ